jgi:hypothetical protein
VAPCAPGGAMMTSSMASAIPPQSSFSSEVSVRELREGVDEFRG